MSLSAAFSPQSRSVRRSFQKPAQGRLGPPNDQELAYSAEPGSVVRARSSEVPRAFAFARDPKDEPYINLAIAAAARYLVSRDADILDLAKPNDLDGARLRNDALELRILDPVSFLAEMRREIEALGQRKEVTSTREAEGPSDMPA
jgi:predicted nucleic acid-binding protein